MKSLYFFSATMTLQYAYLNRNTILDISTKLFKKICNIVGYKLIEHVPEKTPTEKYIEKHNNEFIRTYKKELNENIDFHFYNKEELKEILKENNNMLERKWKQKILYEFTPRGNIVMHYDPYKLGFIYYCDTNSISYQILNAAAMKYCTIYRCHDFFTDNEKIPNEEETTFIKLHCKEELKKEKSLTKSKKKEMDNVFAKFKNYSKITDAPTKSTDKPPIKKKEFYRNKFVYMGKINNMNFLQPNNLQNNCINGFSSQYTEDLQGESNLQKNVLSFKDFKRMSTVN
tara:strand:+ start:2394 stop:3251 length:858 start_codon:yes stop_codon:yes gene_type:complete